jgi:hypothetical protein
MGFAATGHGESLARPGDHATPARAAADVVGDMRSVTAAPYRRNDSQRLRGEFQRASKKRRTTGRGAIRASRAIAR